MAGLLLTPQEKKGHAVAAGLAFAKTSVWHDFYMKQIFGTAPTDITEPVHVDVVVSAFVNDVVFGSSSKLNANTQRCFLESLKGD